MNKKIFIILMLLLCASYIFGGDVANYVNLGFSDNSKYFMFGYYGIDHSDEKFYAELYTVDVYSNSFANDGVFKRKYNDSIQAGQDGHGAFFNLMQDYYGELRGFNINHLNKGRIVYLLLNGSEPKEKLEFRDFQNETKYRVSLIQQRFGSDDAPASTFYIKLSIVDKNYNVKNFTIGRPHYKREGVLRYRIKQVMFSPDERSIVFVVEKEILNGKSPSIRYMVETVNIK